MYQVGWHAGWFVKIVDCTTFVIGNPPPHHGGRYFIVVKLTTDDGVVGHGEIYVATVAPQVVATMVDDVAGRWVIGADPRRLELLTRRIASSGYALRPDPTIGGITSGIEIACWDIVGKQLGAPISDLLGGVVHERLRTYTYLYPTPELPDVYTDPDQAATRALEEVEAGFTAVKLDPAGPYTAFDGHQPSLEDLERSEAMVRAVRDAVGDRADILIGTHGQFTASGARRVARRLERYEPLWFEEPTQPARPRAMATVAESTTIPIATGERLTTIDEFADLARHRAASIWQPNLGRCGGILAAKKIAAIAEANDCQLAPHLYSGPILGAANLQLACTVPNLLIVEGIRDWGGFHADLLTRPVRWEAGYATPSSEPGLGTGLDETVARAHPYDGDELHLSMVDHPVR